MFVLMFTLKIIYTFHLLVQPYNISNSHYIIESKIGPNDVGCPMEYLLGSENIILPLVRKPLKRHIYVKPTIKFIGLVYVESNMKLNI